MLASTVQFSRYGWVHRLPVPASNVFEVVLLDLMIRPASLIGRPEVWLNARALRTQQCAMRCID